MSAKYRVVTEWETDHEHDPFTYEVYNEDTGETTVHVLAVQVADVKQDGDSHVWHAGAYRIVKATLDSTRQWCTPFKPYKAGKGGTVPWIGESAWSAAARTFSDEVFAARRRAS